MASVMREHLRTRDTLAMLVAMHLTNLLLSIPLMQGWGILPAMGSVGICDCAGDQPCAWLGSTTVALARASKHLPVRVDWWRLPRHELAAVLHIGPPAPGASSIACR